MCSVDWAIIASWVEAIGTVATAVIALVAIASWRTQLGGASKHRAAQEIDVAARTLSYAFYDARSPVIWPGEYPSEHYLTTHRTNALYASSYKHVYDTRWAELWKHIKSLAQLRPLAGAVIGESCAAAVEKLARKASELQQLQTEDVLQRRDGEELTAKRSDQDFIAKVKAAVLATKDGRDWFSLEFEADLKALQDILAPHM